LTAQLSNPVLNSYPQVHNAIYHSSGGFYIDQHPLPADKVTLKKSNDKLNQCKISL
jgi:hypothetical protein